MKGQRKRTHISAHEGPTGGMPASHSILSPEHTSNSALFMPCPATVSGRAGVFYITEGGEDLQELEVDLRCKGEKMKLEAIQSKSRQGGPAV